MNCVSVAVSGRLQFPDVSEMTLRTDLKVLDEEKKILRVHGCAKSVRVIIGTDDFLNRKSQVIVLMDSSRNNILIEGTVKRIQDHVDLQ